MLYNRLLQKSFIRKFNTNATPKPDYNSPFSLGFKCFLVSSALVYYFQKSTWDNEIRVFLNRKKGISSNYPKLDSLY